MAETLLTPAGLVEIEAGDTLLIPGGLVEAESGETEPEPIVMTLTL